MISARIAGDEAKLKAEIEAYLRRELMTPYEVHVPAAEGKLMSRIKSETMIDSLYFNEENERYEVSGYVQEEQSILGELKKFM